MRRVHYKVRRWIFQVLDIFYPLFRKFMPLQTYHYAACGGLNTFLSLLTYFLSYNYILDKQVVEEGLKQGILYRKDDGSVWIDLSDEGLDEKLLLRKDGTSVYITQDLGLADEKYKDFNYDQSIYVIADEQNYHMKVLQLILKKLGKPYADGIFHLSYGMVELPSGKMKSREGTVVDADDLVDEMVIEAEKKTKEKSKVEDFSENELKDLYETIALGDHTFKLKVLEGYNVKFDMTGDKVTGMRFIQPNGTFKAKRK